MVSQLVTELLTTKQQQSFFKSIGLTSELKSLLPATNLGDCCSVLYTVRTSHFVFKDDLDDPQVCTFIKFICSSLLVETHSMTATLFFLSVVVV